MFRKVVTFLVFYLSSAFAFSNESINGAQPVVDIPFYDSNRPPLIFVGEHIYGIHADIFKKVLLQSGIKFSFQPTPHLRRRLLFEAGEVVIDCCSNPAWRQRPLESKLQLFSIPIDESADHYIFNQDKQLQVNAFSDLKDKVVGVIRGFSYSGSEYFGHTVKVKTEKQLLELVNLQRVDLAIVNKHVAKYYVNKKQLNIVIGPLHDKKTLHIRLHKSYAELLPKINRSIELLVQSGEKDSIIKRYLGVVGNEQVSQN